jgi:gluconolactonase
MQQSDPRFGDVIEPGTIAAVIADNFEFTEGPIWHPREGHVTFSDIPANRLYRYTPGGSVVLYREPSKDFAQPNGLCLDLDEQHLFVADTTRRHIRRFRIEPDGTLSGGAVFCESPAPDGLKIDSLGNVYTGGPRGVHVYHRDDGAFLGVIESPGFCANFCWGGDDLRTLYLTSSKALLQVPVKVPGLPLFQL